MPARSSRASGRVTPKGTSNAKSPSPSSSRHQRAVPAHRQVDRTAGGGRSSGPPPAAFRRTGHR